MRYRTDTDVTEILRLLVCNYILIFSLIFLDKGIASLTLLTFWTGEFFVVWGCPVSYRYIASLLVSAHQMPVVTLQHPSGNNGKCLQMTKCPLGDKIKLCGELFWTRSNGLTQCLSRDRQSQTFSQTYWTRPCVLIRPQEVRVSIHLVISHPCANPSTMPSLQVRCVTQFLLAGSRWSLTP